MFYYRTTERERRHCVLVLFTVSDTYCDTAHVCCDFKDELARDAELLFLYKRFADADIMWTNMCEAPPPTPRWYFNPKTLGANTLVATPMLTPPFHNSLLDPPVWTPSITLSHPLA